MVHSTPTSYSFFMPDLSSYDIVPNLQQARVCRSILGGAMAKES
jgi:hypothetical protein